MQSNDLSSFKDLYFSTAYSYINKAREELRNLSDSDKTKDAVGSLYISFHSLSSQSALMGYSNISSLSKSLEYLIKRYKDNSLSFGQKDISIIKEGVDNLFLCLEKIQKTGTEIDLSKTIDVVNDFK